MKESLVAEECDNGSQGRDWSGVASAVGFIRERRAGISVEG